MIPTIAICMGSSCFARGNEQNLTIIEQYIERHHLETRVELTGARCEGECSKGPNIRINGTLYHGIDSGTLLDLLKEHLGATEGTHDG